jgi:pre-mRNA-splicing factor ATP-dependent RNA helicase DHX38/PRP16
MDSASQPSKNGPKNGHPRVGDLIIEDTEVMEPETPKRGGLAIGADGPRPVFQAKAKASTMGLDKLAVEKRREREREAQAKQNRTDSADEGPEFKSEFLAFLLYKDSSRRKFAVPSMKPRPSHIRQRPDETPSHGPGLSTAAQKKLDEHRKKRRLEGGMFTL